MTIVDRKKMAGTVTSSQMDLLRRFLKESCFTFTDEWLIACVTWICEENNNPAFNLEFYKRELSEQWMDANLMEMESSCLPPGLATQRLAKLTGKYGLQVNEIEDIGESAYSQWNKLKKLENENVRVAATDSNEYKPSWEPTPKRCLKLKMTDGSQEVSGIEKFPIPALNLNLKPGFKVIIQGPLECRWGIMHLKPINVRIIGGEVEQLVETNQIDQLLARRLNLTNVPQRTQNSSNSTARITQTQSQTRPASVLSAPSTVTSTSTREEVYGEFPDSEGAFPDVAEFGDDDDLFLQIDENALIHANQHTSSATGFSDSNNPCSSSSGSSSVFNKTTQKVTSTSSLSKTPNHGLEIEDYEDDPNFQSRNLSRPAPTVDKSKAKESFIPPTKPAFVPPTRPDAGLTNTSSSSKKATFVPPSVVNKPSTSSFSSSFQSAKTLSKNEKSGSSSSGGNSGAGKQLNIMQYMKPMPVIIDPPTPERQAVKRRRKSLEEGVTIMNRNVSSNPTTTTTEASRSEEQNEVPNDDDFEDDDDDAWLKMIDETVENKLLECENENDESSLMSMQTSEPVSASASSSSSAVATVPIPKRSYPVNFSNPPWVFIKQVLDNIGELRRTRKVVHIKACVSTIVSNIQVDNGCWVLCVSLNDGTGYLECGISAEILNGIIGFSPDEMKRIKAAKTKEGKLQIAEGLKHLSMTLVHLNSIFAVEIGNQPMIMDIIDVLKKNTDSVKRILQDVGL